MSCRRSLINYRLLTLTVQMLLLASFAATAQQQQQCLPCHGVKGFAARASDGSMVDLYVNADRITASVHGGLACAQCHVNMAGERPVHLASSVSTEISPFVKKWRPQSRPAEAACVQCHRPVFGEYQGSIHASALKRRTYDAPFCSDCHGSHYVLRSADLESQVNPVNVPSTCASCHAVGLLMSKYDVSSDTYETFRQSVHGRKLALGESDVAVCTSCHGVHNIRSPEDPKSSLSSANIVETCRKCHTGASRNFAMSFNHVTPSPTDEPIVYWVDLAYRILIFLTVGGMAGYVALDLLRRTIDWLRGRREASG